jgi:hypothetical protein
LEAKEAVDTLDAVIELVEAFHEGYQSKEALMEALRPFMH